MWNLSTVPNEGDVSDRINPYVNHALELKNKDEPIRGYIGGSNIGTACTRKLQYHLEGQPRDENNPLKGDTLRIFQAGHTYEEMLTLWLRNGGFDLRTHDRKGRQFSFETAEGNIKGLCSNLLGGSGTETAHQRPLCWAPIFSIARVHNERLSTFFEYNSKWFLIGNSFAPSKKLPLRGTFALQLSDHIDNYKINNFKEMKWVFRLSYGF